MANYLFVAFFIDASGSLGGLPAVQTSFNLFNDKLDQNDFVVVTGAVNSREDWITPCRSALVLSNQTSVPCTRNEMCASFVCVEGFCRNGLQGIGDVCDEGTDCQNLACGHEIFNSSSPKICCPSHTAYPASGDTWCTGQPTGATCRRTYSSLDTICASNDCVEGICQ
jgi:hypothetical protein